MTRDLETVLGAYVECALWSSSDWSGVNDIDQLEPIPLDDWATRADIAPETIAEMHEDCAAMIDAAKDIDGADWWSDEQFGHDFWLTRNGHGAGFWDRSYGDTPEARAGDALTREAKVYGTCDLYVGDDGRIYS